MLCIIITSYLADRVILSHSKRGQHWRFELGPSHKPKFVVISTLPSQLATNSSSHNATVILIFFIPHSITSVGYALSRPKIKCNSVICDDLCFSCILSHCHQLFSLDQRTYQHQLTTKRRLIVLKIVFI